jgi:hypothetical protein
LLATTARERASEQKFHREEKKIKIGLQSGPWLKKMFGFGFTQLAFPGPATVVESNAHVGVRVRKAKEIIAGRL